MEPFYDAIDTLKGMIRIPSFSREESDLADFLEKQWQPFFQVHRKGNNLWMFAADYDNQKPTVLLNSHIDTVKPVAGWENDPFIPVESDDCLYGLGSNDAGAAIVSLYAAFDRLSRKNQPYNLIFLASAEEEISGKNGIVSVLPELPAIAFGVIGEPTGMHPAIAEKGLMVLDCVSHGKSGHAALNEGVNAISLAIEDIRWFHTYLFPEQSDLLGPVKMTVTMIESGTQHNVVPDRCNFTVDIRTNEFYANEALFDEIKKHVRCEMTARSFRLNSSLLDPGHPFVRRAVMMGREPFGSLTLSDQALLAFPTVKIGPGLSSRSHTADEFIRLSEIREAIELYVRFLDCLSV